MRGMHFINRLMVDEPRVQILSHSQYFPVADGNVACPDDARSRVEESPAEDQKVDPLLLVHVSALLLLRLPLSAARR